MRHPVPRGDGHVDSKRSNRIDMTRRYTLLSGARLIPRAPDTVQIGTDPPHCVVVMDAPRESLRILGSLDGATPLGQVLTTHDADPLVWSTLLEQLVAADLLVPVEQAERESVPAALGAHLTAERSGLTHRHGHVAASRIMQARDDALVVVRGRLWMAGSILSMLAAAGVGHLHHETGPSRALSPRGTATRDAAGPGGVGLLGGQSSRGLSHRAGASAGRSPAPDARRAGRWRRPRSGTGRCVHQAADPASCRDGRNGTSGRRAAGVARPVELPVLRAPASDGHRSGLAGGGPAAGTGHVPASGLPRHGCRLPGRWAGARPHRRSGDAEHRQRHAGMALRRPGAAASNLGRPPGMWLPRRLVSRIHRSGAASGSPSDRRGAPGARRRSRLPGPAFVTMARWQTSRGAH